MFGWLKNLITSRYVNSITRYLLVALVASMTKLPVLAPLAAFLDAHLGELTTLIADILLGLVLTWSVVKNKSNAKVEKLVARRIK